MIRPSCAGGRPHRPPEPPAQPGPDRLRREGFGNADPVVNGGRHLWRPGRLIACALPDEPATHALTPGCSAALESSHLSDFARPEFARALIAECRRSSLYQRIHAVSSRCAWSKLVKLCCQTYSSFKLRKKRSMIPFLLRRVGMNSCVSRQSRYAARKRRL